MEKLQNLNNSDLNMFLPLTLFVTLGKLLAYQTSVCIAKKVLKPNQFRKCQVQYISNKY